MLSVGLVGLPNAGKSTLFNLLTDRSVPAENFPFSTVDPHDGIVEVPDFRVKELAKLSNSEKEVYAVIEFRDIAGLVKNASQGAGLGNQFLSHIREVDLILMIIRAYEHESIIHVENRVNPDEDEEILMLELTIADTDWLTKYLQKNEKDFKSGKDRLGNQKLETINGILSILNEIKPASEFQFPEKTDEELIKWRKNLNLLTDKPLLRLANISQDGTNHPFSKADFSLDILLESSLKDLSPEERIELGVSTENGIDNLIKKCFEKLDLISFLTTGEKESRAWRFPRGLTAPQCAGKIHSDFEKKFIKAEIVPYSDFIQAGGWKQAAEQGKVRSMGKDYLMQDGDVVIFKTG